MNVDLGDDTSEGTVVDHLEQALQASDDVEANFHVRQAMQLLLTEEDCCRE